MPAEWEPQEAIWLSWPHNVETWPSAFDPIPGVFAELAREIAESQLVRINVRDLEMEQQVSALLNTTRVEMANVRFHHNPTNDSWVRDHGPIYVVRDSSDESQPDSIHKRERAILDWEYNSWGEKYPPFDLDNAVPSRIAAEFGERFWTPNFVLEGGSIDVNGTGTLLTTTSCLLNSNRNPSRSQAEIEAILEEHLNVNHFLWLSDGITGDDTDGHIDDITRFVNRTTVVTALEQNSTDENYGPLKENRDRLRSMTIEDETPLAVIELPMPRAVYHENERLPASYANFLITNDKVLVPTYQCEADGLALEILANVFPTRKVVGINCTDLVWGLGAIHCVTQQMPAVSTR